MKRWLAVALFAMGGCASTPEVRDLALKTKAVATRYTSDTHTFVARQAQLHRSAVERLENERLSAAEFAGQTDRQRTAWRIESNDAAERLYAIGSARTAEDLLAAMGPAAPLVAPGAIPSPDLGKAIKSLGEISKPPTREELSEELIAFVTAFRKETDALRKKAEEEAANASKSEADKAKADKATEAKDKQ